MDAHKDGNMLHYVAASAVFGPHSDRAERYLHNDDAPEMHPATKNKNLPESFFEGSNNERN